GMKADGLIRHIGLSNLSAEQLRTAMNITDIAAVTVHYNVAVRLGAGVRTVAKETGIVFSPWHPAAIPSGPVGEPFHAVIDPIAASTAAVQTPFVARVSPSDAFLPLGTWPDTGPSSLGD